jgi:hypothetical protein
VAITNKHTKFKERSSHKQSQVLLNIIMQVNSEVKEITKDVS